MAKAILGVFKICIAFTPDGERRMAWHLITGSVMAVLGVMLFYQFQ